MDDGKAHAGRGAEPPAETALTGSESRPHVPIGSLADARLRAPGAGPARVAMALALQRGLGNAAVQRTLAPRGPLPALLMRAPPTAPEKPADAAASGLSLPEGTNFEWGRSGMDFAVVVRRQWLLDNGAAPDDTRISDMRVVRPLVLGVGTVAPWAKKDDLEAMITSNMRVSIGGAIKDRPEFFAVPLEDFSKRFIGNPPGEDVVVSVRTNEVAIFVDKALVTKHAAGPDATVVLDEAFNARVFAAVEATSGLTLGKHKAPGFRTEIYKDWRWPLNGPAKDVHKTVLVTLAEEDMTDLFGPQWGELQAKPTGEVVAGQVQGRPVMLPADQQASHAKIIKLLNDLFGPAGKEKPAPDAKPIYLGGQALELLEQIAKEKDSAASGVARAPPAADRGAGRAVARGVPVDGHRRAGQRGGPQTAGAQEPQGRRGQQAGREPARPRADHQPRRAPRAQAACALHVRSARRRRRVPGAVDRHPLDGDLREGRQPDPG